MTGILFALLSSMFIAFWAIFLRKSLKEFPPSVAFLFDSFFGLFIWTSIAIFMGISGNVNWSEAILFAFISAILSEAIVFYALSFGELSITATIFSTYPVYTVILSRTLNNEVISSSVMFFVVLAIIGSIIASVPDKLKWSELKINKVIIMPFLAAFCIGLSDTLSKGYINRSNDFSFLFSLGIIQIPVALVYLRIEGQSLKKSFIGAIKKFNDYKFALFGGLFNIIGTGFLWLSFSFAPASIASPITGTNGVLTVVLSKILLYEKISKRKYIGIVLAFLGVLGITLLRAD